MVFSKIAMKLCGLVMYECYVHSDEIIKLMLTNVPLI